MNKILQIYYSLLFYILFNRAMVFINEIPWPTVKHIPFPNNEVVFFFRLFNPPIWILSLIFLSGLFFCFLCIFKPRVYLKIITSVFALVIFLILYAHTDGHHNHIWMISSVLMCFFSSDQSLRSKNYFVLRLTQALLLSHYFISGLWKIRVLISQKFAFSFEEQLSESLAFANTYHALEFHIFAKKLLYQYPELLSFGYFCALLFQMTALLPVFFNRLIIPYGICAILFHFSVGFITGIYFAHTVLAVLFFLIIAETMMKDQK